MIHYINNGKLASFENKESMLRYFPDSLTEATQAEFDQLTNPQPTFDSELEDLDKIYEEQALKLSNEYMIAMARDGANETAKVTAVREKITGLDLSYEQDVLALILKYSGV